VNHISNFEQHVVRLARERGCVGVMCGHIHMPADKMVDGIHYLNSGDWVETLTAIVEHWDGTFELIDWASFVRKYPMKPDFTQAKPESAAPAPTPEEVQAPLASTAS
jgi:hypothetical protein